MAASEGAVAAGRQRGGGSTEDAAVATGPATGASRGSAASTHGCGARSGNACRRGDAWPGLGAQSGRGAGCGGAGGSGASRDEHGAGCGGAGGSGASRDAYGASPSGASSSSSSVSLRAAAAAPAAPSSTRARLAAGATAAASGETPRLLIEERGSEEQKRGRGRGREERRRSRGLRSAQNDRTGKRAQLRMIRRDRRMRKTRWRCKKGAQGHNS